MQSSKSVIISLFLLLIILTLLILELNSNSSEFKALSSLVTHAENDGLAMNESYIKLRDNESAVESKDVIGNAFSPFLNHTESIITQGNLRYLRKHKKVLLKRHRRGLTSERGAVRCGQRNSPRNAHKLTDRCVRKKQPRRNQESHMADTNPKDAKINKVRDIGAIKLKKPGMMSTALLNGKKAGNATNITSSNSHRVNHERNRARSEAKKKEIKHNKLQEINKATQTDLSKRYHLTRTPDVHGKKIHPLADKIPPTFRGGRHLGVQEMNHKTHSRVPLPSRFTSSNELRTNIHSSAKGISNIQRQNKKKAHKDFTNTARILNPPRREKNYASKNNDTLKHNADENPSKIKANGRYSDSHDLLKFKNNDLDNKTESHDLLNSEKNYLDTKSESHDLSKYEKNYLDTKSESHDRLKSKKNDLDSKKYLSQSTTEQGQSAINFHHQKSKNMKIHYNSKEKDKEKALENRRINRHLLKKLKIRGEAEHRRHSRTEIEKVKANTTLSRLHKHPFSKSLKRNTRDEKNILYKVKDFIVEHFPLKREERNPRDDKFKNDPGINGNGSTSFETEDENSKLLEDIRDFVINNFHSERTKRRSLIQRNSALSATSYSSNNDYNADSPYAVRGSKSYVPGEMQSRSFMNADAESNSIRRSWPDIVKREVNHDYPLEGTENDTLGEYDDIYGANITDVPKRDADAQIVRKAVSNDDSTNQAQSENESTRSLYNEYGSDSDLTSDQDNVTDELRTSAFKTDRDGNTEDNTSDLVATEDTSTLDSDEIKETEGTSELYSSGFAASDNSNVQFPREISLSTDLSLVSTKITVSSLGNNFSEISYSTNDVTSVTISTPAITLTDSDSISDENSTLDSNGTVLQRDSPSAESSATNYERNSESSLSSSSYAEEQRNADEDKPPTGLSSTYDMTAESNSVTDTSTVQTSSEAKASKVYRDVHNVKNAEYDYELPESTSDAVEGRQYASTLIKGLSSNGVQDISTLGEYDNKVNYNDSEYDDDIGLKTEIPKEGIKLSDTKLPTHSFGKRKYKSEMRAPEKYEESPQLNNFKKSVSIERTSSNLDAHTTKIPQKFIQGQKGNSLSIISNEYEYDDGNESTSYDLTPTIESNKESVETREDINSKIFQHDKERFQARGNKSYKLAKSGSSILDNRREESSAAEIKSQTSSSLTETLQSKTENELRNTENTYEDDYEYRSDSTLSVPSTTLVSNKVFRNPKEEKIILKKLPQNTPESEESVDDALDSPSTGIELQLINKPSTTAVIPSIVNTITKASRAGLPNEKLENNVKNAEVINEEDYEYSSDAISHTSLRTILKSTPKSKNSKEEPHSLKKFVKGRKVSVESNHRLKTSGSSNSKMASVLDMLPSDSEVSPGAEALEKEMVRSTSAIDTVEKEYDKSASAIKHAPNRVGKTTEFPLNNKIKAGSVPEGMSLDLRKQGNAESNEMESAEQVEVEQDASPATHSVTLQNSKIMPDDTTTSSTEITYSDNYPEPHESLSRLENINNLGEEYYDEVAHGDHNIDRISKHITSSDEMKSSRDDDHLDNEAEGQEIPVDTEEEESDTEESSSVNESTDSATISRGLETSSVFEDAALNDADESISGLESTTAAPARLRKNSDIGTRGKGKEFIEHLHSLLSHLKQRRRNSNFEDMNRRKSRKARAVLTTEPTALPELSQTWISPAKEWSIGIVGLIIMSLLIIGMYHKVLKRSRKDREWEKTINADDFQEVLVHDSDHFETDDEGSDRLTNDVAHLECFIDQVMLEHEIYEDGSMKAKYSTADHLSKIHAATTGTID